MATRLAAFSFKINKGRVYEIDRSMVQPTVRHYSFTTGQPGFVDPYGKIFALPTIDLQHYRFDISTGEILSRVPLD